MVVSVSRTHIVANLPGDLSGASLYRFESRRAFGDFVARRSLERTAHQQSRDICVQDTPSIDVTNVFCLLWSCQIARTRACSVLHLLRKAQSVQVKRSGRFRLSHTCCGSSAGRLEWRIHL